MGLKIIGVHQRLFAVPTWAVPYAITSVVFPLYCGFHFGDVRLQMQQCCKLILLKGSLGRLNVVVVTSYDVRTEAQRCLNILLLRSGNSYVV